MEHSALGQRKSRYNEGRKSQPSTFDVIRSRVYATGRDVKCSGCRTSFWLDIMKFVIDKYVGHFGESMSSLQYILRIHGGTWAGYVSQDQIGGPWLSFWARIQSLPSC